MQDEYASNLVWRTEVPATSTTILSRVRPEDIVDEMSQVEDFV